MSLAFQQDSEEALAAFGNKTVPLKQKQAQVDGVFRSVAGNYDLMNDLLSGGLHRAWKAALVSAANPPKTKPFHHLDVACGSGDIALALAQRFQSQTYSTLVDINPDMLELARARANVARFADRLSFALANAEDLSFPDKSFDLYTIAFGIRNVPRMEHALKEAYRVLKTGGHFLCLEFSQVNVPILEELYAWYADKIIPRLGEWVVGDAAPYRYLVESIARFPDQRRFADLLREAGFAKVSWRNLSGGIAALHSAWRI